MDLIADVMQKADPRQERAALAKLQRLSAAGQAIPAGMTAFPMKDQARVAQSPQGDAAPSASASDMAMRKLQEVLSTKFVEAMMPKDQSAFYSNDAAGEIWRGFQMESLGKALAGSALFRGFDENPSAQTRKAVSPFSG